MQDIILNKMQENMLENTRQIIHFKNLVNQTTEQHQKMTKELEDDKEKTRKSTHTPPHSRRNRPPQRTQRTPQKMWRPRTRISTNADHRRHLNRPPPSNRTPTRRTHHPAVRTPRSHEPRRKKASPLKPRTSQRKRRKSRISQKECVPCGPQPSGAGKSHQPAKQRPPQTATQRTTTIVSCPSQTAQRVAGQTQGNAHQHQHQRGRTRRV